MWATVQDMCPMCPFHNNNTCQWNRPPNWSCCILVSRLLSDSNLTSQPTTNPPSISKFPTISMHTWSSLRSDRGWTSGQTQGCRGPYGQLNSALSPTFHLPRQASGQSPDREDHLTHHINSGKYSQNTIPILNTRQATSPYPDALWSPPVALWRLSQTFSDILQKCTIQRRNWPQPLPGAKYT